MKIQIRSNVFETNSSSTHSIAISKHKVDDSKTLMHHLYFKLGEFGWERDKICDVEEKASYLWSGLLDSLSRTDKNDQSKLETLKKTFQELLKDVVNSLEFDESPSDWNEDYYKGYVNHPEDLYGFHSYVMSSKEHLINYLFSNESYILTGNDNEECCDYFPDEEDSTRDTQYFYKGN